jgi:hypothetical protein
VPTAGLLAGAVAYQEQWIGRGFFSEWIVPVQDDIRLVATQTVRQEPTPRQGFCGARCTR